MFTFQIRHTEQMRLQSYQINNWKIFLTNTYNIIIILFFRSILAMLHWYWNGHIGCKNCNCSFDHCHYQYVQWQAVFLQVADDLYIAACKYLLFLSYRKMALFRYSSLILSTIHRCWHSAKQRFTHTLHTYVCIQLICKSPYICIQAELPYIYASNAIACLATTPNI